MADQILATLYLYDGESLVMATSVASEEEIWSLIAMHDYADLVVPGEDRVRIKDYLLKRPSTKVCDSREETKYDSYSEQMWSKLYRSSRTVGAYIED